MNQYYDIIVVGGGHAGCEAAAAAANMGCRTLLITMDMTKFAQMSCNPAIGGIAKGQIVREIDAMGGYTGIVTDKTSIQFRMLNQSKGPAMWSPRSQCDRTKFSIEWRKILESLPNLDLWQDIADEVLLDNKCACGVKTKWGIKFYAHAIILTNGTFLNGLMHVGKKQVIGGRSSDSSSFGITEQLREFGIHSGRMKTGTSARIDGRSINFAKLTEQAGDFPIGKFSFLPSSKSYLEQLSCYITYTNPEVHEILKTGFNESPLFTGTIKGVGPRYCPSIEDKVVTFLEKERHQIFLEPEGTDTNEYYINGFSSSLPLSVQYAAMQKISGLENVRIFRPGYAIEYDYFPPTQLKHTLESKIIPNLFFAGQINGTTGYEEAAAQGFIAGINAVGKVRNIPDFVLRRDEAYIGVLIDDLVTKGVDEPYRMFTSRSEFRILLRQDNADVRLCAKSHQIGLASTYRFELLQRKLQISDSILSFFYHTSVKPDVINPILSQHNSSQVNQTTKLSTILLRPQLSIKNIVDVIPDFFAKFQIPSEIQTEVLESVEITIKYQGYLDREKLLAEKISRLENVIIPDNFDFSKLLSISTEGRQKLSRIKPRTIGQASRIPGVSPSDVNVLLVYLGR